MKKFLAILAALTFVALPFATAQTYVSQAGSTFFVGVDATKTETATIDIPSKSANGNLMVTSTGFTGSPSGCTFAMYSLGANSSTAPAAAEQTPSITFTTGTHTQVVAALSASDITTDRIRGVYACSTYPTAGTLTLSFAPLTNIATGALTITTPAQVQNYNSGSLTVTPLAAQADPCLNSNIAKTSAVVNISGAAGTTQLVAVSASKAVYVCYFSASVVGTSPTISFEYGTSTTCVGPTALTGTFVVATGTYLTLHGSGTLFTAPATDGLCLVAGGTTPSIQGVISYVVQ